MLQDSTYHNIVVVAIIINTSNDVVKMVSHINVVLRGWVRKLHGDIEQHTSCNIMDPHIRHTREDPNLRLDQVHQYHTHIYIIGQYWRQIELFVSVVSLIDFIVDFQFGWFHYYITSGFDDTYFRYVRLFFILRDIRILLII